MGPDVTGVLAQSSFGTLLFWLTMLLGAVVALFVAAVYLRRWVKQEDAPLGAGFTLSDLRQLHRSGQMSTEEFEKAKAKVLERAKKVAEAEASAASERAPRRDGKPPIPPGPA